MSYAKDRAPQFWFFPARVMIDVFFLHLRGPGDMIEDARVEKIFVFFFFFSGSSVRRTRFCGRRHQTGKFESVLGSQKKRKQVCLSRELHLDEGRIRSCEPIPGSVPLFCHFPKLI